MRSFASAVLSQSMSSRPSSRSRYRRAEPLTSGRNSDNRVEIIDAVVRALPTSNDRQKLVVSLG